MFYFIIILFYFYSKPFFFLLALDALFQIDLINIFVINLETAIEFATDNNVTDNKNLQTLKSTVFRGNADGVRKSEKDL